MTKTLLSILLAATLPVAAQGASSSAVDELLARYQQQGAGPFTAQSGQTLWERQWARGRESRSCGSCHGPDLRQSGKHATTGKRIDPMAPSANPRRLTEIKTIEKWLLRNCKWTLGQECTPQQKGDLLSYLRNL